MNYTASCLNVTFDLIPAVLSGGAASHYARMNINELGGVPGSGPKNTQAGAYERGPHVRAHTAPLREIMHLLIMGVVRGDREQLMNALM